MPHPYKLFNRSSSAKFAPAICVPLVATSRESLLLEAQAVRALQPDIVEWRADFFEGLASADAVTAMARELRTVLGETPLLFTRRSVREGGQCHAATEPQVMAAYESVIAVRAVDAIDCELGQPESDVRHLREHSRAHGISQILSFHNFHSTPESETLLALADCAADLGGDAVKIAVMPQSSADVLRGLDVTRQIHERGAIPVISMAMGELGRITRIAGGLFGSAMTFAAGVSASAPGQMDIDALRAAMRHLYTA